MHPAARSSVAAVLALVAAATLVACGSSGPTQAPATVAPSASDAPIATAVDPTPVGGQEEPPGVVVTAQNVGFEPRAVTVAANVPLALVFSNADAEIPHGFQLSDANGNVIAKGAVIVGPAQARVALPALAPGAYPFSCPVHPNMTGMLTAQP